MSSNPSPGGPPEVLRRCLSSRGPPEVPQFHFLGLGFASHACLPRVASRAPEAPRRPPGGAPVSSASVSVCCASSSGVAVGPGPWKSPAFSPVSSSSWGPGPE
eukprot:11675146-Prorocentrum_lima.AAC.1